MKFRKSADNILLTGLLGGIGEYYQIDPTFIRIGFVLLTSFSIFPMIPLYIIGALIVPEGRSDQAQSRRKNRSDQMIDKDSIHPHNMDNTSNTREVKEEDWSDF